MRRARAGGATRTEQRLLARGTPTRIAPPARSAREGREWDLGDVVPGTGEDSLDESPPADPCEAELDSPAPPYTGYGIYDAHEEALEW